MSCLTPAISNGFLFLGNPMVSSSTDGNSENPSSYVLLWSRERDKRHYSTVNIETGTFLSEEQKCPGHRVLCMTKVENRTWLGTEVRITSCCFLRASEGKREACEERKTRASASLVARVSCSTPTSYVVHSHVKREKISPCNRETRLLNWRS